MRDVLELPEKLCAKNKKMVIAINEFQEVSELGAQKFMLTRPPAEESAAFLVDRFKSSGISLAKPLADEMVRRADNVPHYLQALGSRVFNATTGRNSRSVSKPDIEECFS